MSDRDHDNAPTPEQPAPAEQPEQVDAPVTDAEATAAESGADPAPSSSPEQLAALEAELEQTRKALAEADVRAQAEIQNIRRRAERDVAHAHKFALEKFASDLLAVADSLERALKALDPEEAALQPAREGTSLTLKQLLDTLARHGVESVEARDQPFDPERHEAMAMVPAPGVAANTVIEELERGYTLNGRLLRAARVIVAQGE